MLHPTFAGPQPATPRSPTDAPVDQEDPAGPCSIYGKAFGLTYASNFLAMTAVALLFRYADFVTLLGGSEFHLGWIVGIGMVGGLVMRLAMGVGIDQYGPRLVWLGSQVLFTLVCFAHLAVSSHVGVLIYLLRIIYCCAFAGIFGAAMTFISSRCSAVRVAQAVGLVGTAGFLGAIAGTQIGDLMLGSGATERWQTDLMFIVAGLLSALAIPLAWLATRNLARPVRAPRAPLLSLLRRYHPGSVLLVGVVMGLSFGMPNTFLPTYAAELGFSRIGIFFGFYAPTAVLTRLLTRSWPERVGLRPMILLGVGGLAVSQMLFLGVRSEVHLIVPGLVMGFAHAILFPAVMGIGTQRFPETHRGLGTTLILGASDFGQLVGTPALGAILHYSQDVALPAYPTMFVCMACLLTAVCVYYALHSGGEAATTAAHELAPPHHEGFAESLSEPAPARAAPSGGGELRGPALRPQGVGLALQPHALLHQNPEPPVPTPEP